MKQIFNSGPSQVPNENPLDIDPIAIVIGPDGSVTYNEEPIPLSEVQELIGYRFTPEAKAYKDLADGTNQEAMVTVKADDDGKTQRFIDVVNALASVKIKNVKTRVFVMRKSNLEISNFIKEFSSRN